MRLHIGTSGWVYSHWRRLFYPAGMPEPDWLAFYARHFGSVEINRSFHRLPSRENFAAWRDSTPKDFVFAVKASRFITHMKKLKEPEQTLPPLLDAVSGSNYAIRAGIGRKSSICWPSSTPPSACTTSAASQAGA